MFNVLLRIKMAREDRMIKKIGENVSKTPGRGSITFTIIGFILKILLLSFFVGIILFPFYYMLATSLMDKSEVLDVLKPSIVPKHLN
jgi:ABC-type glycerol-3-phosphate transport system permease component